ncbi:MAG: CBS domain-containing protein [Planctomycetes bacterium]|nr:CBS domain-containing protein [Planctomycetota bacterium]
MQAKELMTKDPAAVRLVERLDAAARVMWETDCGFCPVVDATGLLVGVLTDRDLCMAAYTQGRSLGEIPVSVAMSRNPRTCRGEDPLTAVLQTMQQAQVHRLPVVDGRGALVGVIAMNDLVRAAYTRPAAVAASAIVEALAAVGAPRRGARAVRPAPAVAAAPVAAQAAVTAAEPAEGQPAAQPGTAPPPDPAAAPGPAVPADRPKGRARTKKS